MSLMKKSIVFDTAFLIAAIFRLGVLSVNSITAVFASIEQSDLQSVDLHLEECIKPRVRLTARKCNGIKLYLYSFLQLLFSYFSLNETMLYFL
jgi:hypothetical protein